MGDNREVARRVSSPRFIGRVEELGVLESALAQPPRVVLVSGESGVGKTRLLSEFSARASTGGARVLTGTCIELGDGELPLAPLAGILRDLARELEGEALEAVLGPARPALARLHPALERFDDEPLAEQGRLFELLLGALGRLGERDPLVIGIEDLHWADRSTRNLLAYLLRNLRHERLLLVATYRHDELHRRHPLRPFLAEHERADGVWRIGLERFDAHELAQQLTAILGEPPPAGLTRRLLERSDGNPFFAEELLAAARDGAEAELPPTLREALMLRIERLTPSAQAVVRVAAAAGERVEHELLLAACGLADTALDDALRELVSHHVLVPEGDAFAFRHALLREAVEADLMPGEHSRLHAAIAAALDARGGDVHARVAHHWRRAHRLDRALAASVAAGRAAERVAAFPEAQHQFETALDLWDRVPDADEQAGSDRVDVTRRAAEAAMLSSDYDRSIALHRAAAAALDPAHDRVRAGLIQERLGRTLWMAGRADEALPCYRAAVELLPAEPPSAERARVVAAEGQVLMLRGHARAAAERCREALTLARRVGARAEEGQALNTLGTCLAAGGDHAEGELALRAAMAIAIELRRADDVGRAHCNLGDCLDQAGRIEESARLALDGVTRCRDLGLLGGYPGLLLCDAAQRLLRLGRIDEAESLVEEAIAVRAGGMVDGLAQGTRALLDIMRGDPARERLALARTHLGPDAAVSWIGPIDAGAAELELWEGRPDAARAVVERALERHGGEDDSFFLARLLWLGVRAEADAAQPPADAGTVTAAAARADALTSRLAAQRTFPELELYARLCRGELTRFASAGDPAAWAPAIERADALGMVAVGAYGRWRAGEAALSLGRRHDAVEPLRAAAAAARVLGARPLLDEVVALARRGRVELAAAAPPANAALERLGLTDRESDVLRLVAAGRTNREIGAELYMSPKTASVHVSRILRKLGVRGRVDAAAVAQRVGLT